MAIIGKVRKYKGDRYMVIKTKLGYYPRIVGYKYQCIKDRHSTYNAAKKELDKSLNFWKKIEKKPKRGRKR